MYKNTILYTNVILNSASIDHLFSRRRLFIYVLADYYLS